MLNFKRHIDLWDNVRFYIENKLRESGPLNKSRTVITSPTVIRYGRVLLRDKFSVSSDPKECEEVVVIDNPYGFANYLTYIDSLPSLPREIILIGGEEIRKPSLQNCRIVIDPFLPKMTFFSKRDLNEHLTLCKRLQTGDSTTKLVESPLRRIFEVVNGRKLYFSDLKFPQFSVIEHHYGEILRKSSSWENFYSKICRKDHVAPFPILLQDLPLLGKPIRKFKYANSSRDFLVTEPNPFGDQQVLYRELVYR